MLKFGSGSINRIDFFSLTLPLPTIVHSILLPDSVPGRIKDPRKLCSLYQDTQWPHPILSLSQKQKQNAIPGYIASR